VIGVLAQAADGRLPTEITVTVEQVPSGFASEALKLMPTLLWVILIAGLAIAFFKPIKNELLPRVSGLNVLGAVEATFIERQLDQVARAGTPAGSPEDRGQVARRAQRLSQLIKDAKVLMVNDQPQEVVRFEQILRNLGMRVDIARTTAGALSNMNDRVYDVIISDMARDDVQDEGQQFLEEAIRRGIDRPTIFGVRQYDPSRGVPPHAFGITNRTDELLNLVLDALERVKG
jgi:CheY-like chemotaxis protein